MTVMTASFVFWKNSLRQIHSDKTIDATDKTVSSAPQI